MFSRSCDRGGQAPALRLVRPPAFTVGRGPVPRRASIGKTALLAFGFRAGRVIAGDRPPRYGPGRGSLRYASVRDQAIPNYGHWNT